VRTADTTPVSATEAKSLFHDLQSLPALVLAVSGGPDSTALMVLAARWVKSLRRKPKLLAVTVDHGLRAEAKGEAQAVARLARKLGVAHRTLRWTGKKPKTGLPQAARAARYRLLGRAARKFGAVHILTAHTLDDQAETVLIRMMRGSGITGLAGMARSAALPGDSGGMIKLVRPFLSVAKTRLIATLAAENFAYADDLSNRDATFTRARLRGLMPQLAREGFDARRLALLAERLKRADQAIEAAVDDAQRDLMVTSGQGRRIFAVEAPGFAALPAETALRLLGRAVAAAGDEGPVELGKLEALKSSLDAAQSTGSGFRRTLAGAVVTFVKAQKGQNGKITVERAPPRRKSGGKPLTKGRPNSARHPKTR
jgi:tRNA(Ile)-lysidine synthase